MDVWDRVSTGRFSAVLGSLIAFSSLVPAHADFLGVKIGESLEFYKSNGGQIPTEAEKEASTRFDRAPGIISEFTMYDRRIGTLKMYFSDKGQLESMYIDFEDNSAVPLFLDNLRQMYGVEKKSGGKEISSFVWKLPENEFLRFVHIDSRGIETNFIEFSRCDLSTLVKC